MARKRKGKKSTPPGLDALFKRGIIPERDYVEFWENYWRRSKKEREELIEEFLEDYIEEESQEDSKKPIHGSITKIRATAEKQAEIMGGYVARRNRHGRFSKRGNFYQAIRKRK
jgi:hypothetical protein